MALRIILIVLWSVFIGIQVVKIVRTKDEEIWGLRAIIIVMAIGLLLDNVEHLYG